jgi:hypothetical protein
MLALTKLSYQKTSYTRAFNNELCSSQQYFFDTHGEDRVHNDMAKISNHLEKSIKLVDCPDLDKEVACHFK